MAVMDNADTQAGLSMRDGSAAEFPQGFLWGGATSSCQIEGGYGLDGRGDTLYDYLPVSKNRYAWYTEGNHLTQDAYYPCRKGIDFYHTYREDIALLAQMGIKAFRLSVAWSRIFPTGEEKQPCEEGLAFYESVVDELLAHGIQPVVTILHYDIPLALIERYNGFASRQVVDLYVRYATALFDRLGSKVPYWLTFNEINIMEHCPLDAGVRDLGDDPRETIARTAHHQFLASARAINEYRRRGYTGKVGCMLGYEPVYPQTCNPEDVLMAWNSERQQLQYSDVQAFGRYDQAVLDGYDANGWDVVHEGDLKEIATGSVDFVSFSYYSSATVSADPNAAMERGNITYSVENPYLQRTQWGWLIDPLGLELALLKLYDRYRLPLFIVECGLGVRECPPADGGPIQDDYRIDYLRRHIEAARCAVAAGVDLMGFLTWSPLDMPSAATGEQEKRYGFVYVDADNQGCGTYERSKKASFDWYAKVIATNGAEV